MNNRNFRRTVLSSSLGMVLAFSAVASISAEARTYKTFKVGAWSGIAHVSSKTGAFTHCTGSARYNSGIKLIFSISRNQKWGVGFAKESWELIAGKNYPIQYQVDRMDIRGGVAKALDSNLAVIKLPGDSRLFAQMRYGRLLKIKAGSDLLKFRLRSTNHLLKALYRCSQVYRDVVVPAGKNLVSGPQSNVQLAATGARAIRTASRQFEARARAQVMMAKVGVTARFAEPSKSPKLFVKNDSVWIMGEFMGTLSILDTADKVSIDANLLKTERRKCSGTFQSRTKPTEINGVVVSMRSAICKKSDGARWFTYYAAYPRTKDSTYLFKIYTSKARLPETLLVGERLTKIAVLQTQISPRK